MAGEGDQAVDVGARHNRLAPVRISIKRVGEGGEVGKHIEYGLPLTVGPLQQPAGRAEVGEAHQSIVDELFQPLGAERGRGVYEMHVIEGLDEFSEGEVCATEAVPVAQDPAVRHAQRIDRRFGQTVQQNWL